MIRNTSSTWGSLARWFHWFLGAAIISMIAFGWWMNHIPARPDRFVTRAPWPVDWIDPAPAIARRVADLLGPPGEASDEAGARMIFTSDRPHTLSQALMPFFGGRVPA